MKKTISILMAVLALVSVFSLAACKGDEDDGKALETANTVFELSGAAGGVTIDESVARTLLGAYPQDVLGLKKSLPDYDLRLSATRVFNQDACMVEALAEGGETAEKTFAIIGFKCYVYDAKLKEYLLLTMDGAVKVNEDEISSETQDSSTTAGFVYDENNNSKLQKRFAGFSKEKLGIDKEISEYVLVTAGTTTTASDGELVFVIRLYEKTGTATNFTLAFNEGRSYAFNAETGSYEKL